MVNKPNPIRANTFKTEIREEEPEITENTTEKQVKKGKTEKQPKKTKVSKDSKQKKKKDYRVLGLFFLLFAGYLFFAFIDDIYLQIKKPLFLTFCLT